MDQVQELGLESAVEPKLTRREDYLPPEWSVGQTTLSIEIHSKETVVTCRLAVTRNGRHERPLRLDGDGISPVSCRIDDDSNAEWWLADGALFASLPGDEHVVETKVVLRPEENTKLMGLYASGGMLCTQCEPEGFRRIAFHLDRPDVLSTFDVRIEADESEYPVLLSNGNLTARGRSDDGRHWVQWRDPHPKPTYLFAMVAGDLKSNRARFRTMSGRDVELSIWVRERDLAKTDFAMSALRAAMAWDEERYGREYDLDLFNVVAVDDFNFGAMENKGLNIFNASYILADQSSATDNDFDNVQAVVAHEYFHNWSGNRVTCRDWFQLSLKEGFTVFRDQCFSEDHGSETVQRIAQVRALRTHQFPEDAGPLAHAVRPDSYAEIANFYTATVYNKGAEIIRMLRCIAGREAFRAGTDLYFQRFDGQAVTCDDFVTALENATGLDFASMRRWYDQPGTPRVTAALAHDPISGEVELTLSQEVAPEPGQPSRPPLPLPLKAALFNKGTGRRSEEMLLLLEGARQTYSFGGYGDPPVLSMNRGFSAPVIVEQSLGSAETAFLAKHDDDGFVRYECAQRLMLTAIEERMSGEESGTGDLAGVLEAALADPDRSFAGEVVQLPSEAYIGDQMKVVLPDRILEARDGLRAELGAALLRGWRSAYRDLVGTSYQYTPAEKGRRRLRNAALDYIFAARPDEGEALALGQFRTADNLTDRLHALTLLASSDSPERERVLQEFLRAAAGEPLLIDKWLSVQAKSTRPDTAEVVGALRSHPEFIQTNPNRVRALFETFSENQARFHDGRGLGYDLVAEQIIELDAKNPQSAAKLVAPFGRWARFEASRQARMRSALERILEKDGLSRDVTEQAVKSLAA